MSSDKGSGHHGPGPDAKGKGAPAGKGLGGKEGAVATAAGVAIATGIAWSVYRSIIARKEEEALIEEYYGPRSTRDMDYVPHPARDAETDIKEKIEVVEVTEESGGEVVEETETIEKGWFFGGENKKKPKKPKHKPGKIHEIMKGDTLYGISQRYGVSLEALKAANGYSGDLIYYGEKLVIPPQ